MSGDFSKSMRVRCHSSLPYTTWCVLSTSHWRALKTRSFHCHQIVHRMPLLKKNQIQLKGFSDLLSGWSKWHCIVEKYFRGPGLPFFSKESPNDVSRIAPHLLSQRGGWRICTPPTPQLVSHNGGNSYQYLLRFVCAIHSLPLSSERLTKGRAAPSMPRAYAKRSSNSERWREESCFAICWQLAF